MHDRAAAATAFLRSAGWADARQTPLVADASARRYTRLRRGPHSAILMDAPPPVAATIGPFLRIAAVLHDFGLSAPDVLATDEPSGFVLLEDLGDDLFARLIPRHPDRERALYDAALDVLLEIGRHPAPRGLTALTPDVLGEMVAPAFEWFVPALTGALVGPATDQGAEFAAAITRLAEAICPATPVMALRDYHAENLLWLPQRSGVARVGLLDFQDAVTSHPAYDLVSLLQDARRDVPPALQDRLIARFEHETGQGATEVLALLGAQRSLRILGVFTRLALTQDKRQYLALMPRVWRHFRHNLTHPALAPLARLAATLPEPTAAALQRLMPTAAPA